MGQCRGEAQKPSLLTPSQGAAILPGSPRAAVGSLPWTGWAQGSAETSAPRDATAGSPGSAGSAALLPCCSSQKFKKIFSAPWTLQRWRAKSPLGRAQLPGVG